MVGFFYRQNVNPSTPPPKIPFVLNIKNFAMIPINQSIPVRNPSATMLQNDDTRFLTKKQNKSQCKFFIPCDALRPPFPLDLRLPRPFLAWHLPSLPLACFGRLAPHRNVCLMAHSSLSRPVSRSVRQGKIPRLALAFEVLDVPILVQVLRITTNSPHRRQEQGRQHPRQHRLQ